MSDPATQFAIRLSQKRRCVVALLTTIGFVNQKWLCKLGNCLTQTFLLQLEWAGLHSSFRNMILRISVADCASKGKMTMKNRILRLKNIACAAGIVLLMAGEAEAAVVLIDDDFFGSSTTANSRFREGQADAGWYVKTGTTDWVLSTGVTGNMSNAGSTSTSVSEGAIGQLVSTSGVAATDHIINISFDYNVGADANLFMHLTGWSNNVTTLTPTHNFLNNTGASGGSLQNQGDTSNYADLNILNGGDPNGATGGAVSLTGTGKYTASFDLLTYSWNADEAFVPGLAGPGFSGSVTGVNQLEYIQIAFATSIPDPSAGDTAISIDNVMVSASAVPEPSSFALLGVGLACVTARRRRRRAKTAS